MNTTITSVPGIRAGHATGAGGSTGCTVVLGPFRGAVDIRGLATGTREIDVLSPLHLVPQADAILFTGGSAPGLAAADGVVRWLRQHGQGFDTGIARIPIVPAAVIFDLGSADQASPDAGMGEAACVAASSDPLAQGRVGAGSGATVGKMLGPGHSSPGGIGTCAVLHRGHHIGALVVVNAFGDVLDTDGSILAGARGDDGGFMDSMRVAADPSTLSASPGGSTVLGVIATDAPLSRTALQVVARMASSAVVRRIAPANTLFDGDVMFAVSTAPTIEEHGPAELLSIGVAAQLAMEDAILRAVRHN